MSPTLIIRADATPKIGVGHFMRCTALGTAWRQRGGTVRFVTNCCSEDLLARVRQLGFDTTTQEDVHPHRGDLEKIISLADEKDSWVVLDGYHFDIDYQKALSDRGIPVLLIDDYAHQDEYSATILLNQNAGAEDFSYNLLQEAKLLRGTDYALLREEFLGERTKLHPKIAKRLLITLGGGDSSNISAKVLRAFNEERGHINAIDLVAGPANPNLNELRALAKSHSLKVELHESVENMAPLMEQADIALTAAGSTCWELARLGVPSLMITSAENQRAIANTLSERGAMINLGWHENISNDALLSTIDDLASDQAKRCNLSRNAQALIDGEGATRVVSAMLENH